LINPIPSSEVKTTTQSQPVAPAINEAEPEVKENDEEETTGGDYTGEEDNS
jgi:hypothetical protein